MAKTRLQELMEEFDLTIYSFGSIGLSKDVISKLNRGLSHFDEDKINKLCDFFHVTSDYFLKRSNEGIFITVCGKEFSISADKLEYYKKHGKIDYICSQSGNLSRNLLVSGLDEIETIESNAQLIKLKNEIF